MDNRLTFDHHVSAVSKSCFFHIRAFRHIRAALTPEMANSVAVSLVTSRLDYANSLLFGTSQANLNKLQRIQNTLAKLVDPSHTRSSDALHTLHWLPVRQRINFKIATLTFKLLQHGSPAYLASLIQPYVPSRALRSHGQQLLAQPHVRTSIGSRAFRAAAPKIWNSLPLLTRLSPSLESFKRALKTYFSPLRVSTCERRAPPIRLSARSVRALIDFARDKCIYYYYYIIIINQKYSCYTIYLFIFIFNHLFILLHNIIGIYSIRIPIEKQFTVLLCMYSSNMLTYVYTIYYLIETCDVYITIQPWLGCSCRCGPKVRWSSSVPVSRSNWTASSMQIPSTCSRTRSSGRSTRGRSKPRWTSWVTSFPRSSPPTASWSPSLPTRPDTGRSYAYQVSQWTLYNKVASVAYLPLGQIGHAPFGQILFYIVKNWKTWFVPLCVSTSGQQTFAPFLKSYIRHWVAYLGVGHACPSWPERN